MKYYVESFLSYLYKKVIVSRAGHDSLASMKKASDRLSYF